MIAKPKRSGALVLRLMVGLALLGCPRVGSAQGSWSVISLPPKPGEVAFPTALAVDTAGNLYVADSPGPPIQGRIQKRDVQGHWVVLATGGDTLGQVNFPMALAADATGNLYVADRAGNGRIQKRDAQGNWSVIATPGSALGQVYLPTGLGMAWPMGLAVAVDAAGNLYVTDWSSDGRIQKRDLLGRWSLIATGGDGLGQVKTPCALAVDAAGNLYVAENRGSFDRIQKRDAQGHWSVIATFGAAPGEVNYPYSLALDTVGNLYVGDAGRIQKRDAAGKWTLIAGGLYARALAVDAVGILYNVADDYVEKRDLEGNLAILASPPGPGWVFQPAALAVDTAGNLYVTDWRDGGRIQRRDPQGRWSVIATSVGVLEHVVNPVALTVDGEDNLYVAEVYVSGPDASDRIQKRDAQGNWSVIATYGADLGKVASPSALAVDGAGNLYVLDQGGDGYCRIQKRNVQGVWSEIDTSGWFVPPGKMTALTVDLAGDVYVAGYHWRYCDIDARCYNWWIQKRDVQGNWDVQGEWFEGPPDDYPGEAFHPTALAVDSTSNLYVAEASQLGDNNRIQRRDAEGSWSVIATYGSALGQVMGGDYSDISLAVDGAGSLYVADTGNYRVLKYTPAP